MVAGLRLMPQRCVEGNTKDSCFIGKIKLDWEALVLLDLLRNPDEGGEFMRRRLCVGTESSMYDVASVSDEKVEG